MLSSIRATRVPPGSFLHPYDRPEAYADCFCVRLPQAVQHTEWLRAFLQSRVFRVERVILRAVFRAPSGERELAALLSGESERFAVWSVERRGAQELLLCDRSARTRSWWRTEPAEDGTCLYFGSALVPAMAGEGRERASLGPWRLTIPLHRAYSRVLMASACARLADR